MTKPSTTLRSVGRIRDAVAHTAIFKLLSQLAGVIGYVLLVRLLSENDYGFYQLLYSIPALIGAIFSLGIGNALSRFLPEYFENRRFGFARRFVSWCLFARLLTSIVVLTLIILYWDRIAPIFKISDLRQYFLVFAAITITHFQSRILTLALSAFLLQKWSSGLNAIFMLLKATGYAVASINGLSLEIALYVDLTAYVFWYIGLRIAYARHIPYPDPAESEATSSGERRRVMRYAAFFNFNDVGSLALTARSDYLFIAGFLNPLAVGAYAFCTQLDAMIQRLMPISFFMAVIQPVMFTLDYEKQKNRAGQYFRFLTKLTYLSQFPIFVLFLSVPTQIITVVFAGKFIEFSHVLIATFVFSTIVAFQFPVSLIAQLAERSGVIMASKIFSIYNIAANIILIPKYGIIGAVIATGTANIFKNVFIWAFVRDVASFRGTGRFFMNQLFIWSCCWILLKFTTQGLSPLAAVLSSLVVVGITAIIGMRFADFADHERAIIVKLAGPRVLWILQLLRLIR